MTTKLDLGLDSSLAAEGAWLTIQHPIKADDLTLPGQPGPFRIKLAGMDSDLYQGASDKVQSSLTTLARKTRGNVPGDHLRHGEYRKIATCVLAWENCPIALDSEKKAALELFRDPDNQFIFEQAQAFVENRGNHLRSTTSTMETTTQAGTSNS